jgi:hypothetical protein
VKIRVTAKSITVWLQPLMCAIAKKVVAKNSMCVIATLSQCDCRITIAKTACDCDCKKQLQKIGEKCNCRKPVQKSSMTRHCQIATRLVFASCGCDLVKIRVIAKSVTVWLQLRLKTDGINPVPYRTVPVFHPDHFRIYGKIRVRERERDGMYRERERKPEKHHPVRISGIPF